MRITDLYDLETYASKKKKIAEALISDIESLAQEQFKGNEFRKFSIKIRLEPIGQNDFYCYR